MEERLRGRASGRATSVLSACVAVVLATALVGTAFSAHAAEDDNADTCPVEEPSVAQQVRDEGTADPAVEAPPQEAAMGAPVRGDADVEGTETGALLVHKFRDCDQDGIRDAGEILMADWYFRVRDLAGMQLDAGLTGPDGTILFDRLPEGDVVVTETLQAGWNNTTPLSRTVSVVAGETTHVFFGNAPCVEAPETGDLVIRKFEDLDEDATWDEGEPVLGGFSFTVRDARDAVVGTGTTDENGWLMFEGLAEGAITVIETPAIGWRNTTPLARRGAIEAGTTLSFRFGNVRAVAVPETGVVRIHKFRDGNANAARDAGEPLLPGWSFVVRDSSGAIVAAGVTGGEGMLVFELPAGGYTVTETIASGWTNTTALTQNLTIVAGQATNLFFGNAEPFLPFTPAPKPVATPGPAVIPAEPFLPFTGGEYLALLAAAAAASAAGAALRRGPRT